MPNWVSTNINLYGKHSDTIKVLDAVRNKTTTSTSSNANSDFDFNSLIPMPESLLLTSGSIETEATIYYVSDKLTKSDEEIINNYKLYFPHATESFIIHIIKNTREKELNNPNWYKTDYFINKISTKDDFFELGHQYIKNKLNYGHTTWYTWAIQNWGTKWNACDVRVNRDTGYIFFNTAWSLCEPILKKFAELCGKHNVTFTGEFCDEDWSSNSGTFEFEFAEDDLNVYYDQTREEHRQRAINVLKYDPDEED